MTEIHVLSAMAGVLLVFFGLIAGPLALRAWSDAPTHQAPAVTQQAGLGR